MSERTARIVKTIHAHVDETVEIYWHRTAADVHVFIDRHTAPPLETWKARTQPVVAEESHD